MTDPTRSERPDLYQVRLTQGASTSTCGSSTSIQVPEVQVQVQVFQSQLASTNH